MPVDGSILITGAAGFAGSSLVKALLAENYMVSGLDVVAPAHASLLQEGLSHPDFRYAWKSIQDIQPSDVAGHSVVAHLAAQPDTPMAFDSPRYTAMQNIGGTVDLLEAVRHAGGVSKVLFAGSGNELGRPLYLPMDEGQPPHASQSLRVLQGRRRVGHVGLAPGLWHSLGGAFHRSGRRPQHAPRGLRFQVAVERPARQAHRRRGRSADRDLTYVDDVIRAWMLAMEAPGEQVVGHKFYVGYGEEHTIEELALMCRAITGSDVPVEYADYRPGEEGQREAFSTEKPGGCLGTARKSLPGRPYH